jgi:hypothetical protein
MAQIIDLGKIRFNWAGTYSSSTEYSYNDLVKYGPNLYAFTASEAATNVVPTNATKWTLATEGIDYRGTYTNGTLYYVNDIVTDGTNTYIVITQHTASSGVASGNANLQVIALGQAGLPSQTGNTNKVLATNGTTTSWASTLYLSKTYIGNSQGQAALTFETAAELTDVMGVFSSSTTDFGQLVVVNGSNGANASTDLIVYTADGTNDSGWIDVGITSNDFDAATFGITGPHDGYIFMSAPRTTQFSVTTKLVASGSATLTTSTAHGYTAGDEIIVEGVGAGFDGIRTVSLVPSPLTFRFVTSAGTIEATPVTPAGTTYKPSGDGNLVFATDETGLRNKIVFAAGGFASGTSQMEITPNEVVDIIITTASTSHTTGALVVAGGVGIGANLNMDGDFANTGTLTNDGIAYIGADSEAFAGNTEGDLTSPAAVFTVESGEASFGQVAFRNSTATSSTDIIAYMDNGDDTYGWMGMGIAGSNFDDTTYGITAPGDGYIFHNAIDDTYTGNMVFATGGEGSENKIVFAAGGFASGDTQMEITPGVNVHIEIPTPSTSPSTGALTVVGGVGIQGDMNIQGDVNVVGTITFGGSGTTVETSNLAVVDPFVFVGAGNQGDAVDLGFITEHTVPVTAITATITNKALASNVATLTTSSAHGYRAGDVVVVSGVDATFNGTYSIIDVPLTTTFTYAKTASNVSSTAVSPTGSASVSARRVYDGVARDATDQVIKFFQGAVTKPATTVNFSEAGLTDAAIRAGNGTFTGTLSVTGTATVATPTTSGHATTKAYVDAQDRSLITQTAIVSGDYTYDASNRLTKYKVSANKTVQNITYNASGYIASYQEVVTVGGSAVTTSYTVTTNASGNITAISAA